MNTLKELRPRLYEICINIKFFFRFHVSNGDFLVIFPTTLFHVVLNIDDKITNTFYKLMPRLAQSGYVTILVVIREFNPRVARSVELRAEIYGIPVLHTNELADFCRDNKVQIGVLTVPKEAAYSVARTMVDAGVKGIWNFANIELKIEDKSVIVENIHLGDSLMTLCYEIKSMDEENSANE